MSEITKALLVVVDDHKKSHLVASSPAICGSRPDDRDVICGADYAQDRPRLRAEEVDCGECLIGSPPYWDLPSWAERVDLS